MEDLTSWVDELVGRPPRPPRTRGALETVNDWVIEGVNSGAGVVKSVSDMVSPNNALSRGIGSLIEYGEERQSDVVRNAKAKLAATMENGNWQEQVGGVWDYVTENPGMSAAMIAGNVAPFVGAIRGASGIARGAALARGASGASAANAGTNAGRGAGIVLSGMAAGGDAAGTAYDLVMRSENIPEDQKEALATRAAREASIAPALFGAATGAFGVERIIAGGLNKAKPGIFRTAASEALLQEAPEEALTTYSGRASAKTYDPSIDEFQGVAGAAAMGGAMGGVTGGTFAGLTKLADRDRTLPPGQTADDPQVDLLGGGQPPIRVVDNSVPLQQFPDAQFGIDGPRAPKDYAKQFEEAASEPSDTYVQDPETGVERRLDVQEDMNLRAGTLSPQPTAADNPPAPTSKIFSPVEMELIEFGVVPTKKKVEMFEDAKASGLDLTGDDFQPFWAAMAENKLGNAKKMLAQAVIEFRKGQAAQAPGAVRVNPDAPVAQTQPAAVSPDVQDAPPVAAGQAVTQAAPAPAGGVVAEPAGVPAAGAGASQAPVVVEPTITIGRAGREKTLTRAQLAAEIKKMPATDRSRILATMGMELDADPSTGAPILIQTANPRTADEVAALEAKRTGKKVGRAAINQTLTKWGLTPEKVNTAVGAAPSTVSAEELGITSTEGEATGFRVEDVASKATNQGLVDDGVVQNAKQKAVTKQADELVSQAPDKAEATYDPAQDATLEKRRAAAAAEAERELARLLPSAGPAIADYNDTRFDAAPEFEQLSTAQKLEYLHEYEAQARDTGNEWEPLETLIQRLSKEFLGDVDRRPQADDDRRAVPESGQARGRAESPRNQVSPAETAWNELSAQFPMMPDWSGLSERQQKQVTDLVAREQFNLAAANTIAGGSTLVNKDVLESRSGAGESRPLDAGQTMEFEDLEYSISGVDDVRWQLAEVGAEKALTAVRDWRVLSDAGNTTEGEIAVAQGGFVISINTATANTPARAARTVRHEVAHAMDMGPFGGIYSQHPDLEVRIVANRVIGVGRVAKEIIAWAKSDPQMGEFLAYPLNWKKYGAELSASDQISPQARTQMELFAQMFAVYTHDSDTREFMREVTPQLVGFLESAIRSFQNAPNRQLKTYEEAAARRAAFAAQNTQLGGGRVRASDDSSQTTPRLRSVATPKSGVPAIDKLPATVGDFFQSIKDGASWVGLRTMFTKDLVNLAKQRMPSTAKYLAEMERIWVERGKMEREIDSVLEDFRKLPSNLQGTGPGSVNALIKDSTMERKWAFKPAWVPNAKVDPDMEARFKAMPAEARRVIMRVFEHGHNSLTQMKAAALANINSEYDDAIMAAKLADDAKDVAKLEAKKAKALGDYRSLMEMNSGWPYAPLKRFGKYVVMGVSEAYDTARRNADTAEMRRLESDPAHYFVAFAETKAEARRQQAEIAGRFAKSDHFEKLDQADSWMGGRDVMGAFSRLRTQVRNQAENSANDKTSKAMEDLLRQMYLTMLSENSVRKSEINRRNIAGADNDMMRAFATQGKAQAHFISGLKSNGKANDHLQGMQNEARDTFGSGRDKAQAISNEIARRHAMALEYAPPGGVEKAMASTSVWMLLTNPSYFLVNATQPWMMTHPMLAAKHGYGRSAAALSKAYKDILPMVKNLSIDQEDYSKLPADVRAAVEELADRGVIDISLESHLGNFRSVKDSAVGNAFEKSMTWMRNSAQFVEGMNRLSSAVAAYRLERAAGKDHAAGVAYASKVIYETHGDYSAFNAPRFMRRGFWKLATQFRKFQLIQLSMFARYMQEALKGATPEERLVAMKAITYNFSHLFAMGGLMGLPGFVAISWITGTIMAAFGDDDEPKDPEATLRRIIGDKELADLLTQGLPKWAGVGMSSRVGAGGMLSIFPYADVGVSRESYSEMALGLAGPFVGGILPKTVDGLNLISQGKLWEGTEKILPTLFANAMTATRYSMDGVTRRNGDVVLSPDELTFLDGVAKTLGLPTNTLTDRQFLSNAQFKTDEFYRNKTSELKRAYTEAVRSGDEDARREAMQDWKDTQEARRRVGMKTQPLSELLKAPREQAKRERNTVAGVQVRENNRGVIEKLTATQ